MRTVIWLFGEVEVSSRWESLVEIGLGRLWEYGNARRVRLPQSKSRLRISASMGVPVHLRITHGLESDAVVSHNFLRCRF